MKFKKEFSFGCASSGPQTEGNNNNVQVSNWDLSFAEFPDKFFNKKGPSVLADLENNLEIDLDLMKEIGLNSYRTSISWCKLIKNNDTMEVDPAAVKFYNRLIDGLIERNIEVFINLSHFDLPQNYAKEGGFSNYMVVDKYVDYARVCFELFGDRVKTWFTFNEPIVTATCTYKFQAHYPFEVNDQKMYQSMINMQVASSRAIKAYRETQDGEIGIILNLSPIYTTVNPTLKDKQARENCEIFHSKSFLDPSVKGIFPANFFQYAKTINVKIDISEEDLKVVKENTVDLLGVNYYQPVYVRESTNGEAYEQFVPLDAEINEHRGWIIYPKGIYDLSMELKNEYGNIKYFIAENGMGFEGEDMYKDDNGVINDTYRVDFYTRHLTFLHKAIEEGANCFGFHTWTFVDNWSWLNEYKNRYGFVSLNIDTQERTRKTSSYWYNDLITNRVLKEK